MYQIGYQKFSRDVSYKRGNHDFKRGVIGYGVKPSERRKGYATQMLKYALKECKNHGLNKVIVGCYKENIGSAKAIIKNNGKLIKEKNILLNINDCWRINLVDQFYEIEI